MSQWLKSKFAKDRWEITRISWMGRQGGDGTVLWTYLYMKNRYSPKLRRVDLRGEWFLTDFPGNIYRS